MALAQLYRIGLPYLSWRSDEHVKHAREAGKQQLTFTLTDHLLRDVGLLDGHRTPARTTRPVCSARDMIDRYR